ncbi:hypothetical protein DAA51_38020 [Bradyrhizobium sp. WBAH10]|nr:hypothetical protein [Bradyrhizobium sp. WBAH30]MDD1547481.1 hypothetical protein [Bradyrhizobium sp. WBAH41]MDD1561120.1 hypothetical protein [Bradyrhizobium sp. WBAH23]MDD1594490.1 hypothetical protein [Bradyrhizobium sp. WBAH42]NRB91951.1 hypothetical protein [Bradyrhizobium sp. WBAH10]QCJ93572.1 hypothetical protein DAA57_38110 [Bradyrhizobium yuanmingense]
MNLNHSFAISRSLDGHDRLDQAKLPKRTVEASLDKVLLVAGEIDVGIRREIGIAALPSLIWRKHKESLSR